VRLHWYVVLTRSGLEAQAQAHLERQNYGVYYPRLLCRRRRLGRRVQAIVPLFPRYLFAQLAVGVQDLAPIRSTRGVVGLVKFGGEYAVVSERVIEQLRGREDPRLRLHHLDDRLKPNARVRVSSGPFYGLEGIFLHESGADRVTVLLNLLGRETPLQLPEHVVDVCG
jgi:transcriptional antiterminator RfaH